MFKKVKRLSGCRSSGKRKCSTSAVIDEEVATGVCLPDDDPISFPKNLEYYSRVESSDKHASHSISFTEQPLKFTHRGSLFNVIGVYNEIKEHNRRITDIIDNSGWARLLAMKVSETTHALVDYLVEHWWDTTHTFHFHFGELGITPLDWSMLTGLSIGTGLDIPYDDGKYTFGYVKENIFPELQEKVPAQWTSNAITCSFLGKYFTPNTLVGSVNNVILTERIARAFFMYVLGQFFFSNAKNYIDAGWLAAFEDFDEVSSFDWGGAALANLYVSLDHSSRCLKTLNGPFQILEFWGYEYLGICLPHVPAEMSVYDWPRSSRWKSTKKKTYDIFRPRTLLAALTADHVTWNPWCTSTAILASDDVHPAVQLSGKRVIFRCLANTVWFLGDRCWRQNFAEFAIPRNPPLHVYGMPVEETNRLKEAGWPDASDYAQIAAYDVYLQYWEHVTNFTSNRSKLDWEVELYGVVTGDTYKVTIQKPDVHVPIPPQHQLSFPDAYGMLQEYADFNSEMQKLTLNETRDRMYMLTAKNKEIACLNAEVEHLKDRLQQIPQPGLGFGNFSATLPQEMWSSNSSTPTTSRMGFHAPRRND